MIRRPCGRSRRAASAECGARRLLRATDAVDGDRVKGCGRESQLVHVPLLQYAVSQAGTVDVGSSDARTHRSTDPRRSPWRAREPSQFRTRPVPVPISSRSPRLSCATSFAEALRASPTPLPARSTAHRDFFLQVLRSLASAIGTHLGGALLIEEQGRIFRIHPGQNLCSLLRPRARRAAPGSKPS